MKCPQCQTDNKEETKFCLECGHKFQLKCPQCGHLVLPAANFCDECGHQLSLPSKPTLKEISLDEKLRRIQKYLPHELTEEVLSQRGKIEGERRQVTVVFADMQGFTPLVEKLGPEEAYSIMDQVYEILIHKVHDYEGTVNEMTGDGIMALFGAPIALEDAPQGAIRSALAIHREITRFSDHMKQEKGMSPIRMRIGIHTGPVVVGTLGNDLRVEFKAVGDTVNLASRMEGLAEPGTTYVTEETYRLAKGLFHFQPVGKKMVKGKGGPISVYKVLSAKDDVYRPRLGSERLIYSGMVGRDSELNRLELQVMKVISELGSVVNIIGEAGIGKSRLLAELKNRDVMKRVTLSEGRAISIGKNLSFHPIIDLFRQWAGIRNDDGEAKAFDKLQTAIKRLFPEEYGEVLPFVAILMGMKLSGIHARRTEGIEGEALKSLILKSVRDLLAKAAELTPLVIVIEDLHWTDTSSVELLESLFRLAETHKILFINLFRPGYKETGDRLAGTLNQALKDNPHFPYFEIVLEPLAEEMSEVLIRNMLKLRELQHDLINNIVERTGGNPFFIEEVVRSLIDEQALLPKGGTFHLTDKAATITIPNTIEASLMARIDRLEEQTRDLVKEASVIGRSFFYRILVEVASKIENIDARLSYLQEIQLLRERFRMGELEYLFKHALAQEVTYKSILPLKRKELHLTVARSIEKIFDERLHEFFGMLAYHYCRAESLEKAEECLIKAGEEALKSSASNEALHYYKEALSIYRRLQGGSADPEKVAMYEKNIALALYNRGQYEEAVEHFDKALNYYWGVLPKNIISRVFRFLSASFHLIVSLYFPSLKFRRIPTQDIPEHIDLYYKKIEALSVIDPKRFFLEYFFLYKEVTNYDLAKLELGPKIFVSLSSLFYFSGISFRMSRKILDSAKNRISRDNPKICIWYDVLETMHNYLGGNWKEINNYDDDLVDKNLSIGEIYSASQHLFWHGIPNIYQGCFEIAESIVNRLKGIFEIYENDFSIMLKQLLNTSLLMECRKLHDASIEIEAGIKFAQKTNYGLSLIHMFSCKAQVQLLMGDIEGTEKSLEHAGEIRRKIHSVPWQLSNFRKTKLKYDLYRFEESIRDGNRKKWLEYQKKALKSGKMLLQQSQKVAQHRTESFRLMGVYFWLTKSQKKALMWWHRSIQEGERLGARLELSRTYFEIGKRLLEPESKFKNLNEINSEEYLKRAKVMFEELDLQWDLSELGRVTSG
jgi:class 3 adenylate cyclase/tetratricopeptide (TPR) repeat protein